MKFREWADSRNFLDAKISDIKVFKRSSLTRGQNDHNVTGENLIFRIEVLRVPSIPENTSEEKSCCKILSRNKQKSKFRNKTKRMFVYHQPDPRFKRVLLWKTSFTITNHLKWGKIYKDRFLNLCHPNFKIWNFVGNSISGIMAGWSKLLP